MASPTYAGAGAQDPERPSPFDSLASAVSELSDIRTGLQMLADRMLGPTPTAVGESKRDRSGGPGLIDGIDYAAGSIREMVNDMRGNLHRIERRL